jgi:SAM-dependent methyltransferase
MRPDIGQVFPWIPHAARSSFSVRLGGDIFRDGQAIRVTLVGMADACPRARLDLLFRQDLDVLLPSPPEPLMERVTGNRQPLPFKIEGMKSFGEFMEPICRFRDPETIRSLLDWGCGCGRIAGHFLRELPQADVCGCDIDAEAVSWCNENLGVGAFSPISPWPPTPYPDDYFDVVVGYSVFTHLTRDAQQQWLKEIRRILVPGGLFLASVHGDFAALFSFQDKAKDLMDDGFYDDVKDKRLEGIAPEDYYRATFQTRAYTEREWSSHFRILDYIERGMGNYQDLVVMRKDG